MKNIFLLSTDKQSKLYLYKDKLGLIYSPNPNVKLSNTWNELKKSFVDSHTPQNLYITSDETIEEGWVYYKNGNLEGVHKIVNGQRPKTMLLKKIILTTDEDLINSGVQKIDDKFLQWFIKNSDCESVGVEEMLQIRHGVDWYDLPNQKEGREVDGIYRIIYKLNIPEKEENKYISIKDRIRPLQEQWQQDMEKSLNPKENTFPQVNIIDSWLEKNGDLEIEKQVSEQLELEDAARNEYPEEGEDSTYCDLGLIQQDAFIAGAEWMSDKIKYEIYAVALEAYIASNTTHNDEESLLVEFNEWFENNKKRQRHV